VEKEIEVIPETYGKAIYSLKVYGTGFIRLISK
jgi:hypothetical protein